MQARGRLTTSPPPNPNAAKLAAVDVPAPLEEPDANGAVRHPALYGLSARPCRPRCIPPLAIGGMFVLPRQIAPPARNRSTANASRWATSLANAGEPAAAVNPLTR